MEVYNKNKFPHYEYKEGSGFPRSIGCCCQCIYHKAVSSHPWHNGRPITDICAYVCSFTYEDVDNFMLSEEHGAGCEMFTGNEEWQRMWEDYVLKKKTLKELTE